MKPTSVQAGIRSFWVSLAIAGLTGTTASAADWGFDISAGLSSDDNVTNAFEAADRKADTSARLDFTAGLHHEIQPGTSLGLSFITESSTYMSYSGLSNVGLGMRAQLRKKFGLGDAAPWTALSLSALHRDFRDDNRDGWQYDAGLSVGKRLDERWNVHAIAHYDRYVADEHPAQVLPGFSSAVYDVSGRSIGGGISFLATEADTISFNAWWRNGSVTSVTHPDFEVLEYSDAVLPDAAFGANAIAYRIQATSTLFSVNWNRVLAPGLALNLGYAYRRSDTDGDLGAYYANLFNLSVTYSQ